MPAVTGDQTSDQMSKLTISHREHDLLTRCFRLGPADGDAHVTLKPDSQSPGQLGRPCLLILLYNEHRPCPVVPTHPHSRDKPPTHTHTHPRRQITSP